MGASQSSDAEPAAKKAAAPASATQRKEATPLLPPPEHKRVLGVMAMSAIIWFNVSGGPSGSEEIVAAIGPLYAIGLMLVFVLFYSIPQALITAELSTAFADNGGYSLWVKAAFGDFWAVQESVWSFASGVVDSALYPVLFFHVCQKLIRWAVGYGLGLEQTSCTVSLFAGEKFGLLGHHRNPMLCAVQGDWMCAAEWGCKVFILLLFAAPNFVSTKLVGRYLVSLATFVVLPFFVLLAWGSWHMEWKILTSSPAKEPDWPAIIGVLYWSTAGFDSASTIAGEVEYPERTLPRALALSVFSVILCTGLPLLVAAGNDRFWRCWEEGSINAAMAQLCGPWLGVWAVLSSLVGNCGMFSAEFLEDTHQLEGMACVGLAPRIFQERSARFGTPVNAMLFQLFFLVLLVGLDFRAIMCVDNFFSVIAGLLEFFACISLRYTQPDLPRPFRIPGPRWALVLGLSPAIFLGFAVASATAFQTQLTGGLCALGLVIGTLFSIVPRAARMWTARAYHGRGEHLPVEAGR
jgi:amino acid transporter